MTPDYTPYLILLLPLVIGWGVVQHKRAKLYKANNLRNYNLYRQAIGLEPIDGI